MSALRRTKTLDNPFKTADTKLKERKALPLPILSLQTNKDCNPKCIQNKKIRSFKPPIRENFKKMLEFLKKPERINQSFPSNFASRTNQTKELIRKKMKTNFQFYHSKIQHLLLRTQIASALKNLETKQKFQSQNERESQCTKTNLQRTIRFRKKSKKSLETKSNCFMRWQSFCTSISYHSRNNNRISTDEFKKKPCYKIRIQKRCQSTLNQFEKTDLINGWDDGPVRYATDIGRSDFNDIYG